MTVFFTYNFVPRDGSLEEQSLAGNAVEHPQDVNCPLFVQMLEHVEKKHVVELFLDVVLGDVHLLKFDCKAEQTGDIARAIDDARIKIHPDHAVRLTLLALDGKGANVAPDVEHRL